MNATAVGAVVIFIVAIVAIIIISRNMTQVKSLFEFDFLSFADSLPGATAAPVEATSVTPAEELMTSGTLDIGTAGGIVIWIPNEGHEPVGEERMAEVNGAFLPTNAVIGTGAEVVWLSDDVDHEHTIVIQGGTPGSTEAIATDAYSEVMTFPTAGTFEYNSQEYEGEGQVGSIEVTSTAAVPGTVVGAAFAPAGDLESVTSTLTGAGLEVLSSSTFSYGASGGETVCIVYGGDGTAAEVAEKLTAITKQTPYS